MENLKKYKQNLKINGESIFSYKTEVAKIDHKNQEVVQLGYWSVTTQKHINYAAATLGYKLIK